MNAPVRAGPPVPILVVDDNPAKRLGIKGILAPLGYLIVEAESGLAALRSVMAQNFAVILLDVRMPIMDGFETAARIRKRAESEVTPIIFITAYQSDEMGDVDRYAGGAVDFIFAPVPPEELRAKVAVFAGLYARAEELRVESRNVEVSAAQLRLLTDAAPIGIFQTDSENRYVYTNPRWSEITGISGDEAAGQQLEAFLGAEELVPEHMEGSSRFRLQPPGSEPRIVLVTSKPVPRRQGGEAGWVGTLADITAEVGAEAAMASARDDANEASQLKSDFLANMSHEIRTPMNGVIGMTDLLLETDLDARQRDYAQIVRNSGEALLTIIDDILDFSKVESGKLEVEHIEFDLRTIVHDVGDLLAGPAQKKGLDLVTQVDSSMPAVVSGDPGRVRQVLTNLVGNAVKFTQTGEIVLSVRVAEVVGSAAVVRFNVSDSGVGIAPEKVSLVFQPFVQADTSTSRKYGGTGLGLAISSQLITLMGGDCGVSSELGVGSNFWFTIRVQTETGLAPHGLPQPDKRLAGATALIVDDSPAQRNVLSGYLAAWGMTVSDAGSGEAALAAMRTEAAAGRAFAVALVDREMPVMDGLQLKDAVAADPGLSPPLVLMVGQRMNRDLGEAAESGFCALLSKPIHRDDLHACLLLALGPAAEVPARAEAAPQRPDVPPPETGRLLLAEDNPINQKVAMAMLSSAGYRVDLVPDGMAAVEAVAAGTYDAILMDCQMPELNGYEATAAIRAHEGSARRTPIIALTAGARRDDRERCLAAGMNEYLSKPVSKDALLALVRSSIKAGAAASAAQDQALPAVPDPAGPANPDPATVG